MARTLYHANIDQVVWATDVIRMLLFRDTDAYAEDPDHDFLDDWSGGGGVEISVASYARQTLASATRTVDNTNNLIKLTSSDVDFGTLESGQTVGGYIIYKQVGGDDTTPADDPILVYEDGLIDVKLYLAALINATTITVWPTKAAIPTGTALDFGGGATGTTSGLTAADAHQITIAGGGLAAAASVGSSSSDVSTNSALPVGLADGNFAVNMPTAGWFAKQRSQ